MPHSRQFTYDKEDFNEEDIIIMLLPATQELIIELPRESSVSSTIGLKSQVPSMPTSQDKYQPLSIQAKTLSASSGYHASY